MDALEFIQLIEKGKHKDYEKFVKNANDSLNFYTGENHKEYTDSYKRTETKDQKDTRWHVYKSRTSLPVGKIEKVFNEVHRVKPIRNSITTADEDVNKQLKSFAYNQSYVDYIHGTYKHTNFQDCGSFLRFTFTNTDPNNKKPIVIPEVITTAKVYNYKHGLNSLDWLIKFEQKKTEKEDWTEYRLLQKGSEIIARVYSNKTTKVLEDFTKVKTTKALYYVREVDSKNDRCPAIQLGYNYFNGVIDSPLAPAKQLFISQIQDRSEYCISKAVHAYYKKFQYVPSCKTCKGTGHVGSHEDNKECGRCKGTGKDLHSTSLDVVNIKTPRDIKDMVPLSNFSYYEQMPQWLIEAQKKDYLETENDIYTTILDEKQDVPEYTATAARFKQYSLYNALHPYAVHLQDVMRFGAKMIGDITQVEITVDYSLPTDYNNFDSIEEKAARRKAMQESGAPYQVINSLDRRMVESSYPDNPEKLLLFDAFENLRPFKDKSETELSLILSKLQPFDDRYVLWENFSEITSNLAINHPNFYDLNLKIQKKFVKKYIDDYKTENEITKTAISYDV